MAGWNINPSWNSLEDINEGFKFASISDMSPSDFNKLVENMQFLYTNYLNSEGGELDMKRIYPVGSIYLSLEETFHPAEAFGGTWQKLTDRFLVGAGGAYDFETKGGATSHKHDSGTLGAAATMTGEAILIKSEQRGLNYKPDVKITASSREDYLRETDYIIPVYGSTASENHLPPYLAVYMWKRTA